MTILEQSFVDSYSQKTAPWGFSGLGEIVFLRTYSRKKDNGETETWPETIQRVIDGAYAIGVPYTKKEAEKLFDHVFNLRCSLFLIIYCTKTIATTIINYINLRLRY